MNYNARLRGGEEVTTFGLRNKADSCMIIQTNSFEGNLNVNQNRSLNRSLIMKSRFFLERNWNIAVSSRTRS